jgi:hypothetical protein
MFIHSKVKMAVRLNDGTVYRIPAGFVGDIPEAVASHWLVQMALKSGEIAAPEGKKDTQIEAADEVAKEKKKASKKR